MEIADLYTFYLNESTKKLEVSFRLNSDGQDEIRNDEIDFEQIKNFGFDFIPDDSDDFGDITEEENYFNDEVFGESEIFVEEQEIISFLNEYYLVLPNNLPNAELY